MGAWPWRLLEGLSGMAEHMWGLEAADQVQGRQAPLLGGQEGEAEPGFLHQTGATCRLLAAGVPVPGQAGLPGGPESTPSSLAHTQAVPSTGQAAPCTAGPSSVAPRTPPRARHGPAGRLTGACWAPGAPCPHSPQRHPIRSVPCLRCFWCPLGSNGNNIHARTYTEDRGGSARVGTAWAH